MSVDHELIAQCALGLATPEEQAAVERDPASAAELAGLREVLGALALGLPVVAAPTPVRDRLLASIAAGPLERFAARFAELYDITLERARELLGWVDQPQHWHAPMPGMQFAIFKGGPRYATADCGLLRVAPGARFPWHAHLSEEHSLFLVGSGRDHEGRVYVAGDELVLPAGTAHDFVTISDGELVVAVRHHGVDFAARRPPA